MKKMSKPERLEVEAAARDAVAKGFSCEPVCKRVPLSENGPVHEFDIYAEGELIGGVSTSPLRTSGGNHNTGGFDRACSELLWLSIWPGQERRIHVLTDLPMAEKLVSRYKGAVFPYKIEIYHFSPLTRQLAHIGDLECVRPNPTTATQDQSFPGRTDPPADKTGMQPEPATAAAVSQLSPG